MNSDSADIEEIWRLLRKHVPEVGSGVLRIIGIARERGSRTALAVATTDPRRDPVGMLIGNKGVHAKAMVSELGNEMIDVFRWDESPERFVVNLLAPFKIIESKFQDASREAKVRAVLSVGSRRPDLALRARLFTDLTGWDLKVEITDAH